jgi:uncharacterized membrane protein
MESVTGPCGLDCMPTAKDSDPAIFLLLLLLALPSSLWCGFVLTRLWTWFVMPLGVPAVEIWQAAGIALLVSWLTKQQQPEDKAPASERAVKAIATAALTPLLVWAVGAIFHALM